MTQRFLPGKVEIKASEVNVTGNRNIKKIDNTSLTSNERPRPIKKRRFIFLKLLLFILLCVVLATSFSSMGYNYIIEGNEQYESLTQTGGGVEFSIPFGATTNEIIKLLNEAGFEVDPLRFRILSRLIGFDGTYRAGRYLLLREMNEYGFMLALTSEAIKNPSVDIRIPEGVTVLELADSLAAQDLIVKERFLRLAENRLTQFPFLEELEVKEGRVYPLEGYLYPDTYRLDEGWDEEDLVLRMLDEFNRIYTDDFRERANELGLTTDEVVTLASLIEMEVMHPVDLKLVSSVFHNRLNSTDMPLLQSDTTIQYARVMAGLGRTSTVFFRDLEIESLYNTYIHAGLPPGPISSPRSEAIEAALYPAETPYFFFFATPEGVNIYNATYSEHLADIETYGVSGW